VIFSQPGPSYQMENEILYINRSEASEMENDNSELKQKIEYSDKETLLKIIEALIDTNTALRKYIEIMERE
jgi:hypothetical protein